MKIAYIYDAAYPWVKGGAEKRVYELARRLASRGHEVHWYSVRWWQKDGSEENILMDGIHMHGVCPPQKLYNNSRRTIKEPIYFAIKLLPALMKEDFDIVDCQGFPFFSCFTSKLHAFLGKSSLIITLHEVWGDYWYSYLGSLGFFGKLIERLTLSLTRHMIVVSKKTQQDLLQIKNTEDSRVIPNGIDLQEIERVKPARTGYQVIFAGRLIKEKNIELLVRSMATLREEIPEITCLIIGEGPEIGRIKETISNLKLEDNIRISRFMESRDQLLACMKAGGVFVLPSEREGFGMVVIEANACGMPVVTIEAPHNAAVDLIKPGLNGYISPKSETDLAKNIIKAIENKNDMKVKCINFAQKYDWNNIIPLLEEFYDKTLS